ncbi:MAG: hypothetical protein K9M45_07360, partial [Kiritimatiellales bacterium]|nr:hypothetical protein [Kiritimatiellales bacterium]
IAGTDPTNGASFFRVTSQAAAPGGFVINWDTAPGRVYTVRWTDSLTNSFQSLESGIPYPQNSYTDTVHTAEANSFYELEVARAE